MYRLIICLSLLLSTISIASAQQIVNGSIVSKSDAQPLPGVSIVVKGTNNGTTTDFDGNFSINAPSDGVLVFSYIGFLSQEVNINGESNLQISMEEDVAKLDEVVVVGYGTQKKSDITGAVASVKVDELQSIPLARADEVLQGQVAGVQVNNNDASPNASVSIRIRGVSSINGGSDPLIIIDGVQGANMGDVHPNDIKSMEVLKDASATAIYGSRGASGVILITTKTGAKERKPTLTYNTYVTIHEVRQKLDLLSPGEYARYINENRLTRSLPTVFSDEEIAGFDAGGGTDWQDAIFRTGTTYNHHVNISGGTENTAYSISGDFLQTDGIVLGSQFKRFSVRPNISIDLNENLKFTLNSFINLSKDNPIILDARGPEGSPMFAAARFSPTKSIFNEDGTYTQPGGGAGPNDEFNPVALAVEPIRDNYSNRLILNPSVQYQLAKGLTATITGSYQLIDDEENFYLNERVINGDEDDRTASIANSKFTTFQNTNLLTYEFDLGKHEFKLTGLYEQQKIKSNSNFSSARGFLTNAVTYNDLSLGSTPGIPFSFREEQSLESFMGRLNYAFDGKYLLTITGRSDAASVFAENNKRAFFPSVAVGWNISKENFLADSKTIDNLKLKASYGEVGNAAIGPYQSLAQLVTGSNFSFDGDRLNNGINLSTQAPNPDLKWETTEQWNLGLELSMFNNRVALTADYYQKNTTDLLLQRALLQASGFQTQLVNAGEVENKGIELLLNVSPVRNDNFQWNSTLVFTKNENEVLSLNSGETEIPLGGAGLPGLSDSVWLQVGEPIGLIRGFEYDGVWKSDEAILAAAYGVAPGSPKYVDQNNDGQINDQDIVNIANALPDFTYSINNTFKYKNLDLNVLIIGVQGNDLYNIARLRTEERDNGTARSLLNVWTPQNEDTDVPGHNALGNLRNSDRWVEDGSYLRIKNIILGYNFPQKVANAIGVSSARIYASGTNLFTFTDYSGFDPESNSSGGSDTFAGIDLASFPSQKRYTLGLDIKF
ncbi:TonB-linked outer membrane protein, SusC/RagA family [Flagellimonas pacifica]|uniref:TonB-linked outer membrane protein, SusC/RagA family n=2 Tax=Flagellimonas pacifica TaxID=1247520 RepID=A0A285MQU7_9FLAO|nr:TonB-linked outer membrane protein, SusC/RagA family [Allomuricauda parva]